MVGWAMSLAAVVVGLGLLVWSADRFVDGAAVVAKHLGMSPLLIGMLVVGFGTSAPEMVVSVLAAWQGNPGVALGNAYGSNITNIGLILGLTALLSPIAVTSQILRKELPVLTAITLLAAWQVRDGEVSVAEGVVLLLAFVALMGWSIVQGMQHPEDELSDEVARDLAQRPMGLGSAWWRLASGLLVLVLSSRLLVWGAVEVARAWGMSDLMIGLTVVAIGTSLPELATAMVAVRKGEHDLALGNVMGSNLFNTLAVVGLAAVIQPIAVEPEVLTRDVAVMGGLTVSLFVLGYGFRGPGRINRWEGLGLLSVYVAYLGFLIAGV